MREPKIFLILAVTLVLSACGSQDAGFTPTAGVYRPPTAAPTESALAQSAPQTGSESSTQEVRPTPTPSCTNNLLFLNDLTVPDGTLVEAGEQLDKPEFARF